mgnify:CR=1 FL=1
MEYSTIGENRIDVYDVDANKIIYDILGIIPIASPIAVTKNDLPIVKGNKYRLQ